MNALRLVLLLAAAAPLTASADFINWILGQRELEVITVTDTTAAGRKWPAASPAQPQYYIAVSFGYRDFGSTSGGIREPKPGDALRAITATLAKQGYLPAKPGSPPPTLVLYFVWGTLNADWMPQSSFTLSSQDPSERIELPDRQVNRQQIVRFLGGNKVGLGDDFFDPLTAPITGLTALSTSAQNIYEIAREDFFIAAITAFDLEAARQRTKKSLWTTRIACPSLGFGLPETLPSMLAIAGPHIGRETTGPVWRRASEHFRPDVKIGELQLVEYLKDAPLPVVEAQRREAHPAEPRP